MLRTIDRWYNFRTGEYDPLAASPTTAAGFRDYLPQEAIAQVVFAIRVEMLGMAPLDAYVATLDALTGGRAVNTGEDR
jgi:hypothetical protein